MPRFTLTDLFSAVTFAVAILMAPSLGTAQDQESENPMRKLAEKALRAPNMQKKTIGVKFANDFGLATEEKERWVYQLVMTKQGEATRAMFIRPVDGGRLVIFFIVAAEDPPPPEKPHAFYYYTSERGELIKATYGDSQVHQRTNAESSTGFEAEKTFWLDWAAKNPPAK